MADESDLRHDDESRFVRHTLGYLPAAILPGAFSLLAAAIFTRIFPPHEYGAFSLVIAITGPVTTVLSEWVAQPATRFYAEYERRGRGSEFRAMMVRIAYWLVSLVVVLTLLTAGFFAVLGGQVPSPLLFLGASIAVIAQVLTSMAMPILNAELQVGAYRGAIIGSSGLAVVMPLVLIGLLGKDIAWLVWGQALGNLALLPWVIRRARFDIRASIFSWSPRLLHTMARVSRYGVPMMVWLLASGLLSSEGRYVVAAFRGPTELGVYSANYGLVAGVVVLLNLPVNLAGGALLYRAWGQGRRQQVEVAIQKMTEAYAIVGIALIGATVVLGHYIVSLVLGNAFREGAVILIPVAFARVFWGLARIGHKVLELRERPLQMAGAALATGILNAVLDVWLVPEFGYVVAAYTTAFAFAVHLAVTWVQTRGTISWRLDVARVAQYVGVMALAAAATRLILSELQLTNLAMTIGVGALTLVGIYASLLYGFFAARLRSLVQA